MIKRFPGPESNLIRYIYVCIPFKTESLVAEFYVWDNFDCVEGVVDKVPR